MVLPTFRGSVAPALGALEEAEEAGIHGCFAYDHLWPMGAPGRPALAPFPVLGLLARRSRATWLGTLVARVGLVPDEVLLAEVRTLAGLAPGRVVAGLGTGDAKSADEHRAYGVPFAGVAERRARLAALASALAGEGVATWVGGGSPATDALARSLGAALNLWAAPPEVVGEEARRGAVTWGGILPRGPDEASRLLASLAAAGASWAVVGWPGSIDPVVAAAVGAGISLGW